MITVVGPAYTEAVRAYIEHEFNSVQHCGEGICGVVAPPKGTFIEITDDLQTCDLEAALLPPGVYRVSAIKVDRLLQSAHFVSLRRFGVRRGQKRNYNIKVAHVSPMGGLELMIDWREAKHLISVSISGPPGKAPTKR